MKSQSNCITEQNKKPSSCWDGRISAKMPFPMGWSHATLTLKVFSIRIWSWNLAQSKLEWMGYIPAKFRDSSSRISWFAHRRFLPSARPPTHPPDGNHSAIYPLMRPKTVENNRGAIIAVHTGQWSIAEYKHSKYRNRQCQTTRKNMVAHHWLHETVF